MTKQEFLDALGKIYSVGNRSDHEDRPAVEAWTHPDMAGAALCSHLDRVMHSLWVSGVITSDEHQRFYDDMI